MPPEPDQVGGLREVIEAASMDGAGAVQRFRYIVFPLIRPVLLFVSVIATTDALTLFVQPWLTKVLQPTV